MGKYMGVDTDDPDIRNAVHNLQKQGWSKEQIIEKGRIGMPAEVIDRHFQSGLGNKKPGNVVDPDDEARRQKMRERMARAREARGKSKES